MSTREHGYLPTHRTVVEADGVDSCSTLVDVFLSPTPDGRATLLLLIIRQVGWSNVISGVSGGFTGSYIFSQTIFSLRSGESWHLASSG